MDELNAFPNALVYNISMSYQVPGMSGLKLTSTRVDETVLASTANGPYVELSNKSALTSP